MSGERPFTDPGQIPALYADQTRVARRSSALLDAKTHGRHVGDLTAELLDAALPTAATEPMLLADVGCGTGRPTRPLVQRFPNTHILAVDASAPMLAAARAHHRDRIGAQTHRLTYLQADFHHLPIIDAALHAATAVFCLYHSPHPTRVLAEIARCLRPQGRVVLVTKSADSYHELDALLVATGLDPHATTHPSLYETTTDLPALVGTLATDTLTVHTVVTDRHLFRFGDAAYLAVYLVTVPKYRLPAPLRTDPDALAAELRHRRGNAPITATSTITYLVLGRPTSCTRRS